MHPDDLVLQLPVPAPLGLLGLLRAGAQVTLALQFVLPRFEPGLQPQSHLPQLLALLANLAELFAGFVQVALPPTQLVL